MFRKTSRAFQFSSGGLGIGYSPNVPQRKLDMQDDNLLVEGMHRRLNFYDYADVHPAKKLSYFIVRHLRKIPDDWRNYYTSLYRSEFAATRGVNKNWDQFCYVHDGYRKAKWVLKKYGKEPTDGSIPEPYFSQWANATPEERAWAYRRSFHLKELQALQRETCDNFGSIARDRSSTIMSHIESTQPDPAKTQTGTNVHAEDLPAPREHMIRDDIEMSEVYMMTIQDDKTWNPLLKKETVGQAEFWGFEDEEDEDDLAPSAASARKRRDRAAATKKGKNEAKHHMGDAERSSSSEFNPKNKKISSGNDDDGSSEGGEEFISVIRSKKNAESDLSREDLMKQTIPIRPTGGRVPAGRMMPPE